MFCQKHSSSNVPGCAICKYETALMISEQKRMNNITRNVQTCTMMQQQIDKFRAQSRQERLQQFGHGFLLGIMTGILLAWAVFHVMVTWSRV